MTMEVERYETLVQLAPDPIFLVDSSSGTVQDVNEKAVDTLGYERDQLVGMDILSLHPTEEAEHYRELFEETLTRGTMRTRTLPDGRQLYLVPRTGEQIPVELHSRTISVDGETWVYTIARDITERKQFEEQLETQRDLLEVLNQVVRHDIRNDLQVVETYAELLEGNVDEDAREYRNMIEQRTKNAVEFTETAGELAEVIRHPDRDQYRISLTTILETQRAEIEETYEDATITFAESPPAVDVMATEMLESVFRNLLQNAIQHNDADSPEVTLSLKRGDGTVKVTVADNGPGIPDRQKETMFEKGEKGLESEGSGLGLYLAQTLIDGYGGDIWVEDNDPRGSVFTVRLPVADAQDS